MDRARLRPGRAARVVDVSAGGALIETDWRLLPGLRVELQVGDPVALFRVAAQGRTVDLRPGAFAPDEPRWADPSDYAGTQAFARVAREARVEIIRYRSVRDPPKAGQERARSRRDSRLRAAVAPGSLAGSASQAAPGRQT